MKSDFEQNWNSIDKLAYDLYSKYMISLKATEQAADWWFKKYKEQQQFKKFYAIAERKNKIEKIIQKIEK
jgi:hypothetical protein